MTLPGWFIKPSWSYRVFSLPVTSAAGGGCLRPVLGRGKSSKVEGNWLFSFLEELPLCGQVDTGPWHWAGEFGG